MFLWYGPTLSKTKLVTITMTPTPIHTPILVMIVKEGNAHHHHHDVTTEIVLAKQEREEREEMIPTTPVFVQIPIISKELKESPS